jgi:hypothetical protein
MSSIRSTLIRSCFANIQKELLQLEDWLNRDFTEVPKDTSAKSSTDSSIIYEAIQQLSKQMDSQQHTLHHIIDRIDVLEETRNIHIQEKDDGNLWLDTEGVQLQNEIVDYEPIINVNKTEEAATEVLPVVLPSVLPEVLPVPVAEIVTVAAPVEAALPASVTAPVAAPVAAVVESVAPITETVKNVIVHPEEEEDEEEEEDGLEEVEYNGTTYYRDSNLVMYQLDDEGELTDAVGVWREKTQAIKFYKK